MKKRVISWILACMMLVGLVMPAAQASDRSAVASIEIDGTACFRLNDLKNCSDITVQQEEASVILEEDGLTLRLTEGSGYIYRDQNLVGSMKGKVLVNDGVWYAPMDFYDRFLCGQQQASPSLFHGTLFYKQEVLDALAGKGTAAFNRKLLDAVQLPTSMHITTPHVNMERIFQDTPLSAYPVDLSNEMVRLGFQNPGQMKYSEYVVAEGAQTAAAAGLASLIEKNPDLKDRNPDEMTVAEYKAWEREHAQQQYEKELRAEVRTFAKDNDILLSDLSHLNRYYQGGFMEKSQAELKQVLTEYYAADLEQLKGSTGSSQTAQTFKDVNKEDWFFENVMFAYGKGLMNGTSEAMFSPNQVISRAQIVTILWRMDGEPKSSAQMQFTDVPDGMWYSEAIRWASGEEIVSGYGDRFGVNDPITREQFAAILWRYSKHKGVNVTANKDTALDFEDAQSISEYAVEAMRWACGISLMKGNSGKLLPANTATRAEAAAMIQRFYHNVLS